MHEKQPLPQWTEIIQCRQHSTNGSTGANVNSDVFNKDVDQDINRNGGKVMYGCFLIHAHLEKHNGEVAMQVYKRVIGFCKVCWILVSLLFITLY